MWRGLPISTWLLLAAAVGAGPALYLLRRWADMRRGRGVESGGKPGTNGSGGPA